MKIFKIAFRNIFRNKRRSGLTISIIVLGISFSILGMGWFGGILNNITEETVKGSGDIRVTSEDFELKEKSMDVSSNVGYNMLKDKMNSVKGIKNITGVIKFGASIFVNEDEQKPALGFGVEKDSYEINKFKESMIDGRFLNFENHNEIIIGEKLKRFLKLKIGDEVSIFTKTQNSSIAANNYKIVGFFSMENGKMNQSFYITLRDAQYLLDMDGVVTEILTFTHKDINLKDVKENIIKKIGKGYRVKKWNEIGVASMMANILAVQKMVVVILAMLAGIGIANTMVMVIFERRREIGVMKSIGVSNSEVGSMLLFEGTFIGIIGASFGAVIGGVILFILSIRGVNIGKALNGLPSGITLKSTIYPEFNIKYIIATLIVGIVIAVIATILPIFKIVWKEPAELLKD